LAVVARRAFTLVEIVVVVLILGVLAGVAAPRFLKVTARAQASAELQTARAVLAASHRYKAVNGEFPGDALAGAFPEDLDGYLQRSFFNQASPAGGQYDWDGPPPHAGSERFKIRFPVGTAIVSRSFYSILEEADDGLPDSGWITTSGRFISFWP